MTSPFVSLRHRNFRLYWGGQCISLVGTWMQRVAQMQLVVELTKSSFKLGLVSAAQFTPMLFLTLYAGVLADRFSKRRILLWTQALLLVQAAVLAVLSWTGAVRYWHVLILAFSMGVINSFDTPTRQSYMIELVGREDVVNAVALHSMIFNLSRIIGPIIAGLIMARYGMTACFSLNAVSFVAVILGLYLITAQNERRGGVRKAALPEIVNGLRYVLLNQTLRDAVLLLIFISIFAQNFNVMITSYNAFTLSNDERILGLLWSAMGLGALLGSLRLAVTSHRGVKRRSMILFGVVQCLALLALAFSRSFWPAALALVAFGLGFTGFNTTVNSTLQTATDDAYLGRVMSLYTLVLAGLTPIGSLFFGAVAEQGGPPAAIVAGSGGAFLGILLILGIWQRRGKGKRDSGGGDPRFTPPELESGDPGEGGAE